MRKIDYERLPQVLQEFDTFMKVKYSNDTRDDYLYRLLDLHDFLMDKRGHGIEELSSEAIIAYIGELRRRRDENKISDNSIKISLGPAITYSKWLCKRKRSLDVAEYELIREDINELPYDEAEVGRGRVALTDAERSILTSLTNLLWFMLVWVGVSFGLRRSEYVKLRTCDVLLDADRPVLRIVKSKGGKTREIPLHAEQVNQWRQWFKYRATLNLEHDYVFYHARTLKPLSRHDLNKIFVKISVATKVHVYPHKLRYSFAVFLYEHKVDLFYIARALGHSSLDTTVRYLKIPWEKFFDGYLVSTRDLFEV
jgi:site-specific recombinase XerD